MGTPTQAQIDRLLSLMQKPTLTRDEFCECCRIGGLVDDQLPDADLFDADGKPHWYSATFRAWHHNAGGTR